MIIYLYGRQHLQIIISNNANSTYSVKHLLRFKKGCALKGPQTNTALSFIIHHGIDDCEADWTKFGASLQQYHFYHKPAWFKAYTGSIKDPQAELIYIGIYWQNDLIGIIPFEYIRINKLLINIKVLRLPWHAHLDLADIILAEQIAEPLKTANILPALLDFLNQQPRFAWDVIFFGQTPAGSHSQRLFENNSIKNCYSVPHGSSSYIQCKQNYTDTVAHITSKFKRNLSRLERKAEKQGDLCYQSFRCSQPENIKQFPTQLDTFLQVEADSWKADTHTAIIFDHDAVNFYQSLCENFTQPDSCVINRLQIGDEVIAVQFGIQVGNRLNLLKIGFRQKYKSVGPGNIILSRTLKSAIEQGVEVVSTTTAPPWADKWKSDSQSLYRHIIFSSSLAGQAAKTFFLLLPQLKKIKSYWQNIKNKYFKNSHSSGKH